MGVIGELFVRLGLKTEDYKEGVKDAQKENASFKKGLEGLKAGAVAVWAAIGASVVKFAQEMYKSTNRIGDAWDKMTAAMSAGWGTFVKAVSNFDFDGLITKIQSTAKAAKELQGAIDAQFEGNNSIRLQRAWMSEELEALKVKSKNPEVDNEERIKAAQEYLRRVTPLYKQEIALAAELMDAHYANWIAGSNLKDNEATRNDIRKFLIDYTSSKNKQLVDDIAEYHRLSKSVAGYENQKYNPLGGSIIAQIYKDQYDKDKAELAKIEAKLQKWGKDNQYTNSVADLATVYDNWRGDVDTGPLVEAIILAEDAKGKLDRETAEMQAQISALKVAIEAALKTQQDKLDALAKKANKDRIGHANETADILKNAQKAWEDAMDLSLGDPDLELGLGIVEAEMDHFIAEFQKDIDEIKALNDALSDAISTSLVGSVETLVSSLFDVENADPSQILSALVQPFADSAIQLGGMLIAQGVAIEAFKTSLASLNGFAAVAAGTALVAAGAAMKAGIQALANRGANATAATTAYDSSNYTGGYETFESNITVEVVGRISGSDIVIAGSKQLNKWGR